MVHGLQSGMPPPCSTRFAFWLSICAAAAAAPQLLSACLYALAPVAVQWPWRLPHLPGTAIASPRRFT